MPSPEELAREKIDKLLTDCGWTIQNRNTINLSVGKGIAIREARSQLSPFLFDVRRWTLGVERLLCNSAFPFLPVGSHFSPITSHWSAPASVLCLLIPFSHSITCMSMSSLFVLRH